MKKYSRIKRMAKTVLLSTLVLGSLIFGLKEAKAQQIKSPVTQTLNTQKEEKIMPERKLILDFANPINNFEADSNAWCSTNQLFGKGSDLLGLKLRLDTNVFGRIALLGLDSYRSYWSQVASHELGHTRAARKYGDYTFNFEMNSFLDIGDNFPRYFKYYLTDEELIEERIAGLNQDEFNSYTLIRNNINDSTVDNEISFLLTKFWDVKYNLFSSESANRHDVKEYIRLLNKKGINLSKQEYLIQSVLADMLSMRTWGSFKSIFYNYLIKGERSVKPITFRFGKTDFTPPLISHYITPEGSFYNISSFINPNGENPIEVSIGTDIDFIGGGRVNHLRLGGQYNDIKLKEGEHAFMISPFAYLNTDKSFDYKGFSAGLEAKISITKTVKLRGKAEYNKNDMIENIVKGEDKGVNFVAGLDIKF